MAFTGLRRQSIVRLTVEDIAQIGPQVFALTWKHGKPGKQRIAVIPALIAEYLQHYIRSTGPIRARIGKQDIFFARTAAYRWDCLTVRRVSKACTYFVSRHTLTRDGATLRLGSTILRRTYATRVLYELPSIAALQAQLGHNHASTTLGYVQHDRFEHPAQVDGALDAFGRRVLVRWHTPILLDNLPDAERQTLLGARTAHEQDVGLCRHCCCVKLDGDHLPPCVWCLQLGALPFLCACSNRSLVPPLRREQLGEAKNAWLKATEQVQQEMLTKYRQMCRLLFEFLTAYARAETILSRSALLLSPHLDSSDAHIQLEKLVSAGQTLIQHITETFSLPLFPVVPREV